MFEAAQPQVASPPEKPCKVREVWQSQTCARSRLSLLSFFGEAKKESARAGMRRKGEQIAHSKRLPEKLKGSKLQMSA